MSSAVVVPPPNSSSVMRHVPRLTSQARNLLTAVNLHFAGVAALGVLIFAACIGAAIPCYRWIERPMTDGLRRRLVKRRA